LFRSITHVDLTETQGLDLSVQALARKRELSESIGKKVALQAALVDVVREFAASADSDGI